MITSSSVLTLESGHYCREDELLEAEEERDALRRRFAVRGSGAVVIVRLGRRVVVRRGCVIIVDDRRPAVVAAATAATVTAMIATAATAVLSGTMIAATTAVVIGCASRRDSKAAEHERKSDRCRNLGYPEAQFDFRFE